MAVRKFITPTMNHQYLIITYDFSTLLILEEFTFNSLLIVLENQVRAINFPYSTTCERRGEGYEPHIKLDTFNEKIPFNTRVKLSCSAILLRRTHIKENIVLPIQIINFIQISL